MAKHKQLRPLPPPSLIPSPSTKISSMHVKSLALLLFAVGLAALYLSYPRFARFGSVKEQCMVIFSSG